MKTHCLIYSTAPSKKEAAFIAKKLIESRIAACVNIFPKVESFYQWRSKIERSSECAMLIKSQRKHFKKIVQCIQKYHTYTVPANC